MAQLSLGEETVQDYKLFGWIKQDFFYDKISRPVVRELLYELGFQPCEVFGLMELLGLEKEAWEKEGLERVEGYE